MVTAWVATFLAFLLKGFAALFGGLNSNSFPKPLSAEEEAEYIARTTGGDAEAREKLITHNLRLVAHICKKYYSNDEEIEDLISIGTIGLIKAINTFKAEKQVRLSTYASRCIENEILMHLRNKKRDSRVVSFEESVGIDKDGNRMTYSDILGTDGDTVAELVERSSEIEDLQNKVRRRLNKKEREILTLRYGLSDGTPKTQQTVADLLNISRSYVSRIEGRGIRKLMKEYLREITGSGEEQASGEKEESNKA
ncbi:RNA polymerase, sigma-70 factor family [Heliomicrobium modesticaldum Ice1]|uniref:RNA polymerase, sigma-70 factor family n=1 Tax=Heliobacterium modesticaldum (strain ATCC 51547 / Ice1) TaxID=498761 RepID=B0TC28_HELMI|nr:RNA polymerase sporulation sigma factor SigK [Heliomicrobium modesticaldum]ABZ85301.1 RNA polymerase, sigma-70 factor family [Heliomicrobium modesticaldum Ice1]